MVNSATERKSRDVFNVHRAEEKKTQREACLLAF